MLEVLPPFVAAVLALMVIPGPDMALVMANGAAYGGRGAFFSSLGISSGGMALALATSIIVATAMSIDKNLLAFIQLAGCLYLACIAFSTIYPKACDDADQAATEPSRGNLFLMGVITNISNPKALIFFTAFIPQFIPSSSPSPPLFALALGTILCSIGFVINFAIGATGTMVPGLGKVAFLGRTWSQWTIFAVFLAISIAFAVQFIS